MAGLEEDHVLGDVGDPVGDALQVVGDEDQVGGGVGPVRLLAHDLDHVLEDPVVDAVDPIVAGGDVLGPAVVAGGDRLQDVPHLFLDVPAHSHDAVQPGPGVELDQRQRVAGAALGVVAHALQLRRHQHEPEDLVQLGAGGVPDGEHRQPSLPLLAVALVEVDVPAHHRPEPLTVVGLEAGHGVGHSLGHQLAQHPDPVPEGGQVGVELGRLLRFHMAILVESDCRHCPQGRRSAILTRVPWPGVLLTSISPP